MGNAARSLHVVEECEEISELRVRPKTLSRTAPLPSRATPSRADVAIVICEIRDRRLKAGDRSCSLEAMAGRADLSPTRIRGMLDGEVGFALDRVIALGTLGEEILVWALATVRSRLLGGSR